MKSFIPFVVLLLPFHQSTSSVLAEPQELAVKQLEGKIRVTIGDQLFTELDHSTYAKPILYPIHGPDQIPMTRNHPMIKGVTGEAEDHPHHKSMWFGHGDVNKTSFWHEQGTIVTEKVSMIVDDPTNPSITLANKLVDESGNVVCHETATISFQATPDARIIDWDVTLHADAGEITLGDTKEGTMALRTHPNLRLENDSRRGVTTANGRAVNSEGITGKDVWGKRAKWVDYSGEINGATVGISFFDHPRNLRHPTYWHARAYGLVAANPFGLSNFVGQGQDGSHVIPEGQSLRFQYRFVFHRGDAQAAKVAELYEAYKQAAR